jgi:hypothetical protein
MKNIPIKYAIILIIIILALIGGIIWQSNKNTTQTEQNSVTVISTTTTATTTTTTVQVQEVTPQTTPVAVVPKKTVNTNTYITPKTQPITQTGSYTDYMNRLNAAQNSCSIASKNQYQQLYGNLSQSSYNSYYNTANGRCYVEVKGVIQQAYSTTTVGHIYFKDITTNTSIAECTDPTGTLYLDSNWTCKNNVTGQTVNKAEFNAILTAYVTK